MVLAMPMMAVCYPHDHPVSGYGTSEGIPDLLRAAQSGVLDIPLLFLLNGLLPMYGYHMVQPIVVASLCWQLLALFQEDPRGRRKGPTKLNTKQKGKKRIIGWRPPGSAFLREAGGLHMSATAYRLSLGRKVPWDMRDSPDLGRYIRIIGLLTKI